MKNILYILILFVLVGVGVFVYTQRDSQLLGGADITASESVLSITSGYINRRAILDGLQIDVGIFSDARFRSLRSFSKPVIERPIGRDNPFTEVR